MSEWTDCDTCDGTGYVPRAPFEQIGPRTTDDLLNPCPDCNQEMT